MAALVGLGLLLGAAARYPGGTWCDRGRLGHDALGNYWCDLLHARALGGLPNPGAPLAGAGLAALLVALGLWFWGVAELRGETPRLASAVRALGTFAVAAGVGVPLLPSDRFGAWHFVAVVGAGVPGLLALTLAVASAFVGRATAADRALGAATLGLAGLDLALYVRAQVFPVECSAVVPAVQKVATLLLVAWLLATARDVLRAVPAPRRQR